MSYQLVTGQNVTEQDIADAVELDKLVYPEHYQGKLDVCLAWHRKNPNIYTMVKDEEGRVIAYVNVLPVTLACYMDLYHHGMNDTDITEDMVLPYTPGTSCCIYLASIVIHPSHRSTHVLKMLATEVLSQLMVIQTQQVFIFWVLAHAVSPAGIKLCNMLKMRQIRSLSPDSILFDTTFHMLVAAGSAIFT